MKFCKAPFNSPIKEKETFQLIKLEEEWDNNNRKTQRYEMNS